MFEFPGKVYPIGLPTPFVNVYNVSFGWGISYNNFDELYFENKIPLRQALPFGGSSGLGDISTQSIVHVNLGVIENDQQYRVTFYWETAQATHVQILVKPASATANNQEIQYDRDVPSTTPGSRVVLVTGDGQSAINLYFRPTVYPEIFFKGVEWRPV